MSDGGGVGETGGGRVALSCRHLWKIYGGEGKGHFRDPAALADPLSLAARIRETGAITAAVDVGFDVHAGEIFVIMGLSGSGKSTVVRCLSRLVEPTHGEVVLDGEDLLKASNRRLIEIRRHKMGMVFQGFGLMPHLTVAENVAFPLSLQRVPERERRARVEKVIALVGLEGRETSFPHQLSGGQQQRVGIARSLAVEPELWLLDEPFSALDPLIRRQMQDEFLDIQRRLRKSIVFITHDFLEALRIADRILLMRGGQVVQIGRPIDLILNPADDYVAEFTRDVPLVRVLTAADVLDEQAGAAADVAGVEPVRADTSVEALLPVLARHPGGLPVARDGALVGTVSALGVMAALARRAEATGSETGEPGAAGEAA